MSLSFVWWTAHARQRHICFLRCLCIFSYTTFYGIASQWPSNTVRAPVYGNFSICQQCFSQLHLKSCHSGGPAGDEAWLGIADCLKLIFPQTAQDKPFCLSFPGFLFEYWHRPSTSHWSSGKLKNGFRRSLFKKCSFSTYGRILQISLNLILVGRHRNFISIIFKESLPHIHPQ